MRSRLFPLEPRRHAAESLGPTGVPFVVLMGVEVDISCPACGERILDARTHTTCPQCHAELVRNPDPEDSTWRLEAGTPPSDDELGCGD